MQRWEVLAARPLVEREPWLRLWEEDVRLPNGHEIEGYLMQRARDYAMVFAVRPDGMVPIVQQYKHGLGRCSLDLPAGYLDTSDEPLLAAAQRELREETGLGGGRWRHMASLVVDSNRGNTSAHLFLAQDVVEQGEQELDDTEELNVTWHTPGELLEMVMRGQIDSVGSVAGVLLATRILAVKVSREEEDAER